MQKSYPRIVAIDPEFKARHSLVFLAWAIDEATGREFVGLSLAHRDARVRKLCQKINNQRKRRQSQGKPYFLSPTGFAVTGPLIKGKFQPPNARK